MARSFGRRKQSQPLIVECTKYERPHSRTYHNGGPVEVEPDINVTPRDDGWVVVARFDAIPNGWFKLVFPIFVLIMKRAERSNAELSLKDSDSSSAEVRFSRIGGRVPLMRSGIGTACTSSLGTERLGD